MTLVLKRSPVLYSNKCIIIKLQMTLKDVLNTNIEIEFYLTDMFVLACQRNAGEDEKFSKLKCIIS